jgi:hypothetical protein
MIAHLPPPANDAFQASVCGCPTCSNPPPFSTARNLRSPIAELAGGRPSDAAKPNSTGESPAGRAARHRICAYSDRKTGFHFRIESEGTLFAEYAPAPYVSGPVYFSNWAQASLP